MFFVNTPTAEVLRLRATSSVSLDEFVGRFAQDYDFLGELTGTETFVREPGAQQIPRLRPG